MNLAGEQLVLDTNILVYWLRGKQAGAYLRAAYDLGARRPRPVVPVVVKAEIKSFALQCGWGPQRLDALDELLRDLPVADISAEPVLEAYAMLDHQSTRLGRRMGKNDLWIAALARVLTAVVLTTDGDFDHLSSRARAHRACGPGGVVRDMTSGPTLGRPHTPSERMRIVHRS